jgi:uncharacterized membrane protein
MTLYFLVKYLHVTGAIVILGTGAGIAFFMQIEMRHLAAKAVEPNQKLPPRYYALFHRWFLFGIPGFGAVMAILWLMIAKPF